MPLHPTWTELLVRLLLTLAAGFVIGWNREVRGHSAGLRTTLLVCLAASVAMMQMNLLLPVDGKAQGSFAVLDLMRLPLGILTGVGFIGGGAILKRGSLVVGVTTASTLWMATVVGLCLGGGQVVLGVAATAVTVVVLAAFKYIERRMPRLRRGVLAITERLADVPVPVGPAQLGDAKVQVLERAWDAERSQLRSRYQVRFRVSEEALLQHLAQLSSAPTITRLSWTLSAE